MKKFLSCFLLVCFMIVYATPVIQAESTDSPQSDASASTEDALTFSCLYSPSGDTVELNGTINHSTMVSHNEDSLAVYVLSPGMQVSDVQSSNLQPIAKSDIAIRFHFSIPIERVAQRYSRYVMFLCSPDGGLIPASEPKYPTVASATMNYIGNKEGFKGVSSSLTAVNSEIASGSTVIPVDIHALLNRDSMGYPYQVDEEILFFDAEEIHALDLQIRSASAVGSRVYLQFLLPVSASSMMYADSTDLNAQFALPNLKNMQTVLEIEAIAGFLSARYHNNRSGIVHGMIVGKGIDCPSVFQYVGDLSAEEYIELYTVYLLAVANGARAKNPAMEMVIPFTDANSYAQGGTDSPWSPSALLETLLVGMEGCLSESFSFTTLIESDCVPLGISADTIENGIDIHHAIETRRIYAETILFYTEYLKQIQQKYQYAPSTCMFVWNVPAELQGNALSCAYAYTYLLLVQNPLVTSFVASFDADSQQILQIKRIMKYVDAQDGLSVLEPLLPYFGVDAWEELLAVVNTVRRSAYSSLATWEIPSACIGSFAYEDYSSSVEINDWFLGDGCLQIKSDSHPLLGRAMRMDMGGQEGQYGEALCLYEFQEAFTYTPYLAFHLLVDGEADSLYEIKITVGNGADCLESTCAVSAGGKQRVLLDLRCLGEGARASFIKISARMLSDGEEQSFSVWLQDMVGYSTVYASEELGQLIEEERQQIKNELLPTAQESDNQLVWIVFTVVLMVGSLAVGIFIWLYREDKFSEKE